MDDSDTPTFVSELKVQEILNWPLAVEAVEQAMCATSNRSSDQQTESFCNQPARSFTFADRQNGGILLTMPGYVGNYRMMGRQCNTLACKLVTSFKNNGNLDKPLPHIMANILLFDHLSGKLKCIIEGTEITAWRTAAASIVATKYLYFARKYPVLKPRQVILAIIGCGVQGRIHSIGMCHEFDVTEIRLWNRTITKAHDLRLELKSLRCEFKNKSTEIVVAESIVECVKNANIIVTATFSSEPLVHLGDVQSDVHINAIGAGESHHSEISEEIYSNSQIFVDYYEGAKAELKNLNAPIYGEIGEVINGTKNSVISGITIFQSMGMASEDATVAEAVWKSIS